MPQVGDEVKRLTAQELAARLRRKERIALLDVRGREAWASDPEIIPGAAWAPLEEVPQRLRAIPPGTDIVLYCA